MNKETILLKLKSTDPSEKIEAINTFFDEDITEEYAAEVTKMITDSDKGVRNAAASILTFKCDQRACKELVPFIASEDISVRNLAGEILIKNGSVSVPSLVAYLDKGNDDDKKFIIDVLGLIEDPSAAPKIHEILKVNKNDNVILACLEALGRLKCKEAVEDVIIKYDENELFKPTCIEALGSIGTSLCLEFIVARYLVEDELTKYSMIEALGQLGLPDSIEFMVQQLEECEPSLITPTVGAIYSLAERYAIYPVVNDRLKSALIETIREGELGYKRAALSLAGDLKDKEYFGAILHVYGIDYGLDEQIKEILYNQPLFVIENTPSLLERNDKNSQGLLILVRDVIFNNVEIFESEVEPSVMKNLLNGIAENLTNSDEEARKVAMELLFVLDVETGLLFLDTMLEDDNLWNKIRLLEMLEEVNDKRADNALRALSNDQESMISERATAILENRTVSNL